MYCQSHSHSQCSCSRAAGQGIAKNETFVVPCQVGEMRKIFIYFAFVNREGELQPINAYYLQFTRTTRIFFAVAKHKENTGRGRFRKRTIKCNTKFLNSQFSIDSDSYLVFIYFTLCLGIYEGLKCF